MKTLNFDEHFMKLAYVEAQKSMQMNEVPVGAIIVIDNKLVSQGHNQSIFQNDPTSHAEINAIRSASENIGNYRLAGATMYVTLEPCVMCYGAIVHARISRLVFGAYDPKTGACGSALKLHEEACFNHTPKITGGVLEKNCSSFLKDFFKDKRN